MIETKGFIIVSWSDPSVGIFERRWEVRGDYIFDTQEELDDFRESLKQTWEQHVDEISHVISFEELEREEREIKVSFLTEKQKHLVLHTCGLDSHYKKYRNRYVASTESEGYDDLERLVDMGIMGVKKQKSGMRLYYLTKHGDEIATYIYNELKGNNTTG